MTIGDKDCGLPTSKNTSVGKRGNLRRDLIYQISEEKDVINHVPTK